MQSLLSILLLACLCTAQDYEFPENFTFGVATASYQVEGAWNVTDKGESIWDWITHTNPDYIADQSNGDVACDTYHKTAEDVQLLTDMNVNFYRFSISWPRLLPTGHTNLVSEDGLRYYNEVIDELIDKGIEPMVTMFHWDLPLALHEIGGWPNPLLADIFEDYADTLYSLFGDRVKNWITFNEPYQMCESGYGTGALAPGYVQEGIGGYLCGHTLLLAHAKAYRKYEESYKDSQEGKVGITVNGRWYEPATESDEDVEAAENMIQMTYGWFVHPIYSEDGDYPPVMRERIDALSDEQGFPRSRLPTFTASEIADLKGSSDFLGLNHYTTSLCAALADSDDETSRASMREDTGANCYQPDDWEGTDAGWLKVTPWGLKKLLNWIKDEYSNPEIIITENGFSDSDGNLTDCRRIDYFNSYLTQVLEAIFEDGCNVSGYTAWSFMDNFEWASGYTERFGIHYVDFEDPDRPRTPKMSAYVLKNIIETRRIDSSYTPEGFEPCGASCLIMSNLSKLLLLFMVTYLVFV